MTTPKRRALAAAGGVGVIAVVVAVAAGAEALWPVAFGCVAGTVVLALSPVDERRIPNHPSKLPFFVLIAGLAVVFIAVGRGSLNATLVVTGVFMLAISIPAIVMLRRGKNPWWFRGWLDFRRKP